METFTDDTVVALASFLSPCDMLSLALTCKRFGDKRGTDNKKRSVDRGSGRVVRQRTESIDRNHDMYASSLALTCKRFGAKNSGTSRREARQQSSGTTNTCNEIMSLMEVAARTVLFASATENERNALPRRGEESWIGIYHEFLSVFRTPLQFDKVVGDCLYYAEGSNKTMVQTKGGHTPAVVKDITAICSNIMRAGKHSVSFEITDNQPTFFCSVTCGIMRPTTKDITSLTSCHPAEDDLSRFSLKDYDKLPLNVDCSLLHTYSGSCLIRGRWETWNESMTVENERWNELNKKRRQCLRLLAGMEESHETSFKIGMVLDLDEGTLDVYKNGRLLGTMMTHLTGEYCWVVQLSISGREVSVSIGR